MNDAEKLMVLLGGLNKALDRLENLEARVNGHDAMICETVEALAKAQGLLAHLMASGQEIEH